MPAAKEKISFQLVARFMALLLFLAATAASAQARSAAENRVWKKSAPITESLLSQPLQLLELHQVKAPVQWYDASGYTFAAEGAGNYENLVKQAQEAYPNKAGNIEQHHITPQYLGGAADGPTVPLDAAYHQQITNEFRRLYPYGQPQPSPQQLQEIMQQVYQKYPLPPH